jgi:hypothetical protein
MLMSEQKPSIARARWRAMFASALFVCGFTAVVSPQIQLDVCGCKNSPASLGNFDTLNSASYPPGTVSAFRVLQVPLPADGVLVFNSVNLQARPSDNNSLTVTFVRNAANTPATLLVAGNVSIPSSTTVTLTGDTGVTGSNNAIGKGGLGGPGGFRGGDGGYQLVNFALGGGAGFGPGGGLGGTNNYTADGHGASATTVASPDLLPLVGGSGGGGGASTTTSPGCAGGGGGGGGGALLIAADGTLTINGTIVADGGNGGSWGNSNCASGGGGGSGGMVRLLATTIAGSGNVYSRGGTRNGISAPGGLIRMEALNNTMPVGNTDPVAARTSGPGPLVNPITPTVAITSVGGQAVAVPPQGGFGAVDIVLAAPGLASIGLATSGVPTGTTVNVTVKPRVGPIPLTLPTTLTNCDATGACLASVNFDLPAGAYVIEARATFQTP